MSLEGSTVLITGGTGSFGNRVARYLMDRSPAEIRIYSRDEKKQAEMRRALPDLSYVIGDVRDVPRLTQAMRGVDFVFHAAALKHVPACEDYPGEAMKTNAIGSMNVCEVAVAAGVRTVVALSTDKAVKPINAMGISKALMEKIVTAQNLMPGDTTFACVRYGNVMNSRGSVIPLFREWIRRGEPIRVTVPQMTRFLLTLDQSVELVAHALVAARGGEIFVRKAPACTVMDLARVMRRKYSAQGDDHPMEIVGTRPGEKIHEVLVNEYEIERAVEDTTFITVQPEYRRPETRLDRTLGYEYTSANTEQITDDDRLSDLLDQAGETEEYL